MTPRLSQYPWRPSPHHSPRPPGTVPVACVIHYTASGQSDAGDIAWFQDPESDVSAHFIVSREGAVTQLVDLDRQAWHAGKSSLVIDGAPKYGCNAFTIGIELDNLGPLDRLPSGTFVPRGIRNAKAYKGEPPEHARLEFDNGRVVHAWWEPYDARQIAALHDLLNAIRSAGYGKAVADLVGHEEISPDRKSDPGPLFPWEQFERPRKLATRRGAV